MDSAEDLQDLERRRRRWPGQGVGEEIGPRPLPEQIDDLLPAGDAAAGRAAEGLAEGRDDDVDLVHDAAVLVGAAALRADEARGVGVVDHDQRVVPLGQIADPGQLGDDRRPWRRRRR